MGQMTQPTVSKQWRKWWYKGSGFSPTASTLPCYSNTTYNKHKNTHTRNKRTQNTHTQKWI